MAGHPVEQVGHQGRGHVVGQVGHQHPRAVAQQGVPVQAHGVGLDHGDPRRLHQRAQHRHQAPVDLDRRHRGAGLGQGQGERPKTGTDLDDPVPRPHARQPGDAAHRVGVGDEVLAPGPARAQAVLVEQPADLGAGQRHAQTLSPELPGGRTPTTRWSRRSGLPRARPAWRTCPSTGRSGGRWRPCGPRSLTLQKATAPFFSPGDLHHGAEGQGAVGAGAVGRVEPRGDARVVVAVELGRADVAATGGGSWWWAHPAAGAAERRTRDRDHGRGRGRRDGRDGRGGDGGDAGHGDRHPGRGGGRGRHHGRRARRGLAGTDGLDAASRARASSEIDRALTVVASAVGPTVLAGHGGGQLGAGAETTATGSAGAGCGALRMYTMPTTNMTPHSANICAGGTRPPSGVVFSSPPLS